MPAARRRDHNMMRLEDCGVCAIINAMKKPETHRRPEAHRRKRIAPLSGMQIPEAVKTVLRHPRRLKELLDMLGDRELFIRGRAAATLAWLAESHPESLVNAMPRLREHMNDDSDYVRWHIVYAIGEISVRVPTAAREYQTDVFECINDESRIVRMIAVKAASRIAAKNPDAVAAFFSAVQRQIPPEIAKFFPESGTG